MFNKKPRRNFRKRQDNSSDDEDEPRNGGDGEEKETAAAVVKKPSNQTQGRGIACSSKRDETPPTADRGDGEVTEDAEERRKDRDAAKNKKNTVLSFSDDKESEGPTFQLKKSSDKAVLFQVRKKEEALPAKTTSSAATAGGGVPPSRSLRQGNDNQASPYSAHHSDDDDDDEEDGGDEGDGDDSDNSNASDSSEAGVGSLSPSSASDSSHSTTKPMIIPSAREIEAARKKRHAHRTQKEFISLSRDGRSSASSTPDHYSREDDEDRIEEDDDDEPDDHEKRIEFAPRMKSVRERIAEKLGDSDGSLSGTDGEEQELWEETQIGKGIIRHPGEQSPSGSECSSHSSTVMDRQQRRKARTRIPKIPPPVSVSMVKKRIAGELDSLRGVHRARQAELRRLEGDVENARASVELLEETSSELQLKFYRAMTLYVHNLVECLREKIVDINSLELELHTLLSDHMGALAAQRRQKTKEQAGNLQQLSYSTDEPSGNSEKRTDAQGEAEPEKDCDEPEDSELPAEEEEQLQKRMADLLLRAQAVFSDVQDDFSDVKKILSRFEEWRGSHADSYHSAYISLCLPKLLTPIIRHQLLSWNPLKDDGGGFENLPWFTAVETFCHGYGHEELEHTDRQTLSNVIEKTVLPKMTAYVDLVWDPMSRRQTTCLTDVCHKLKEEYSVFEGEQSKPVKAFTEAVIVRLRSCVDEDVFIPLYPKKFLEDCSSPQRRFRDQQFWTTVKLLSNIGKWDLLLPEPVLKELMLDKLLNRYLIITLSSQTLHNNGVGACRKIADSLPLSWLKGETECLPQLNNFRNHLVQKVHDICKQQPPKDPTTRSAVTEVLLILSRIRCNDSIMAIANKYHYEDIVYSHQLLNQETA